MDLRLFLAGDALITQPWSGVSDPDFVAIVREMRAADVTIINLETVIHEFKGHAQADSAGGYMASPPQIAGELKWAGVDMVAHANNHTFDYGSIGILETLEHVDSAGLILAGSGKDLQEARRPRTMQAAGRTVALVAMTASFFHYGAASRSRPGMRGRPGLNPLALRKDKVMTITPAVAAILRQPAVAAILRQYARLRGGHEDRFLQPTFSFKGINFQVGDRIDYVSELRVDERSRIANLAIVREASETADCTVVSVHAHRQGRWLRKFAHAAIAEGADIVFIHGPHEVRGIEVHDGRPIFYCLGDFVFQWQRIERHPAEAYEKAGLGDDANFEDLIARDSLFKELVFEGVAAILNIRDGWTDCIELLPLDLQFAAPFDIRGRPRLGDREFGARVIGQVAERSKTYGTAIAYDPETNRGIVEIPKVRR